MTFELSRVIIAIVAALGGIALTVLAVLHFLCRGPLISQAWTLGTPEQRAALDKKSEYRSTACVLAGLALAFFLLAPYVVFESICNIEWLFWLAVVAAVAAIWLGMFGGAKKLLGKTKFFSSDENVPTQQDDTQK